MEDSHKEDRPAENDCTAHGQTWFLADMEMFMAKYIIPFAAICTGQNTSPKGWPKSRDLAQCFDWKSVWEA